VDFNETLEKALAQARELQKQMFEAANQATGDMKPQLEASLRKAQELQKIFSRHATDSSAIAAQQAQTASKHLNDMIAMGSDAMKQSAEQTRVTAQKMAEQAQAVVDAATKAAKPPN
jgi:outer membrane scaffolding protein for murein synthesis (MipA/OmpV family)